MSHQEKRASLKREVLFGLFAGIIYGGTNVLVGNPFDTVKTKM